MAAGDGRSYTGGRFFLEINNSRVAYLKKFDGLSMEADIVANDLGPDNFQAKHVANIKWTPGKATVGAGMGKGMYEWIKQSFDKSFSYQSGSLTAADFDYRAQSTLTFTNALITSCAFPKLDGSSKDAIYLDVEFDAEQVRWAKGDNSVIKGDYGVKQKAWLASNFKFQMGGLPCARVATVDAMTWKCAVAPDQIGIFREPTKHPAKVTVPDIKISVSMADYEPWQQAAKKWFIDGHHLGGDEMEGSIELLGPDMQQVVGTIELKNCGFKKFSKGALEANSEKIARFDVEFYCEHMTFTMPFTDK
jgi:hypothetical protein